MHLLLLATSLLFIKHFIVDFPLQQPFHYKNKGTYGHLGGIEHAYLHGMGTLAVLLIVHVSSIVVGATIDRLTWIVALSAFVTDAVVHYHIDWAKVNINTKYRLKPDTSEYYWWLLGGDQLAHAATYIALVWYIFS